MTSDLGISRPMRRVPVASVLVFIESEWQGWADWRAPAPLAERAIPRLRIISRQSSGSCCENTFDPGALVEPLNILRESGGSFHLEESGTMQGTYVHSPQPSSALPCGGLLGLKIYSPEMLLYSTKPAPHHLVWVSCAYGHWCPILDMLKVETHPEAEGRVLQFSQKQKISHRKVGPGRQEEGLATSPGLWRFRHCGLWTSSEGAVVGD